MNQGVIITDLIKKDNDNQTLLVYEIDYDIFEFKVIVEEHIPVLLSSYINMALVVSNGFILTLYSDNTIFIY